MPSQVMAAAPCVCGQLRRVTRSLTRVYDEALAPSGLTVTRFNILRTLMRLETPTLVQLAKATAHEQSGLWRTLQPLLRSGAVESVAVEGLRGARLRLTPKGHAQLTRALPAWNGAQQRVNSLLGTRRNPMLALLRELEALS